MNDNTNVSLVILNVPRDWWNGEFTNDKKSTTTHDSHLIISSRLFRNTSTEWSIRNTIPSYHLAKSFGTLDVWLPISVWIPQLRESNSILDSTWAVVFWPI